MNTIGIDEAGRGSLVGPLIVAGVYAGEKELAMFRKLGICDSKKLTQRKREVLFRALEANKVLSYVVEIFPDEVDLFSINELELCASAQIFHAMKKPKATILLDVPAFGKGIERYCKKLKDKLSYPEAMIIGGNRMESKYLAVAAASIVAKVRRDRRIEELKKIYGDFGSGYPNARTSKFVREHYASLEPIVRKKWKTLKSFYFASAAYKRSECVA